MDSGFVSSSIVFFPHLRLFFSFLFFSCELHVYVKMHTAWATRTKLILFSGGEIDLLMEGYLAEKSLLALSFSYYMQVSKWFWTLDKESISYFISCVILRSSQNNKLKEIEFKKKKWQYAHNLIIDYTLPSWKTRPFPSLIFFSRFFLVFNNTIYDQHYMLWHILFNETI